MKSVIALMISMACGVAHAQVVLDGTLGPAGPLAGPDVIVPASSGTTVGSNLFHSFSQLDIPSGESVTFTGPGSVQNVLARVTSGTQTTINGAMRCDIPNADLYLINPAGVVFGPGSALEVRGSFAVTSADFIRLGDGPSAGRFDAKNPGQSVLITAAPSAFGFAGDATPGAVLVRGNLGVGDNRSVSVVGGDVRIVGGDILAASGNVNLVAARGGDEVSNASPPVVTGDAATPRGTVEIRDGAIVDVDGPTVGRINVRGGSLEVRGATANAVVTSASGPDDAVAIDVSVDVDLVIGPGGSLVSGTVGAARAGDVRVAAPTVMIESDGSAQVTGIASQSIGPGAGGTLDVNAGSLRLAGRGGLFAFAAGTGRGGDINVTATGSLDLADGGQIVAQVRSAGAGGNVTVNAPSGTATLAGASAAITSDTRTDSTGDGGAVLLDVRELRVSASAFVSATTNGAGDAGDITINAELIDLDGGGIPGDVFTGLGANTQAGTGTAGRGGSVTVIAESLAIREGAGIAARTVGGQNGGNIDVQLQGELLIDARASGVQTGINAEASGPGVSGGRIEVQADRVELYRGQITATAEQGDGGEVSIRAPQAVHLFDSEFVAEAGNNGGNVFIDPVSVVLQRSRVSANAIQGNGGNILIRTDAFIPSADPETAVTASSEFGLVGTVEINAPDTEIAGALVNLPSALATGASLLPQCGANLSGNVSSFVATGRGGVPPVPGGWQAALHPR